MAKLFLGSVGHVQAFEQRDKKLVPLFTSKTLTDSAVNISVSKDEIRGGMNAPIQFNFYHDPVVEVTLTDIVFKKEYITAQLGEEFTANATAYHTKSFHAEGITYVLTETPKEIPLNCGEKVAPVWITEEGKDEWKIADVTKSTVSTINGLTSGKDYCIRYLAEDSSAREVIVHATIVPKELFLLVKVPLFAGDACSASKGKVAGSLTYEIYRFVPNGAFNLAAAMSSNSTIDMSGTALAVEGACEDEKGDKILRIIEVEKDTDLSTGLTEIGCDSTVSVGDYLTLFGVYGGVEPSTIPWTTKVKDADGVEQDMVLVNSQPFTGNTFINSEGKILAAGSITIGIRNRLDLSTVVTATTVV